MSKGGATRIDKSMIAYFLEYKIKKTYLISELF
ncbi:hypothetical protein AvCA_02670 [Azotobacter vinelandii CA]|uniref:Uncharacterized protein n=2 Tax=Azotobacter vinelandii TaxID=354 RepID=C1DI31_AZOVD|nr:hypothetical protein Avin_02670 [Azotobacter vinelandii DJ]AGK15653.1 hypothetical protein AvCA_02670 [Azotobacter vinelandii CA]AGK19191.1 hypothetical protein AvCA6_02670 [Azotobacter vinelandii CA6]